MKDELLTNGYPKKCDICGGEIKSILDDNNAEPLVKGGRCCSDCNVQVVMARLDVAGAFRKFIVNKDKQ